MQGLLLPVWSAVTPAWAVAGRIASARLWPAQEYTRLIIETPTGIGHQLIVLKDPHRIALDLDSVALSPELQRLATLVKPTDPYIAGIRFGRRDGGVRVVVDLRSEVVPQLFALQPIAEFGYRLILDLYPTDPIDPLMALAEGARPVGSAANTVDPVGGGANAGGTTGGTAGSLPAASPPATGAPNGAGPGTTAGTNPGPSPGAPPVTTAGARPVTEPATGSSTPAGPVRSPPGSGVASPGARSGTRNETRRPVIVAIDPGHGGEDPGAVGRRGTTEKEVVLAIARKLKGLIDAEPGMRAMLTRDDDYYVPLATRVQKARRVAADLFISIHADAFTTPTARGSSVFALSEHGATSAAARWLAQKENAADLIGGVNLGARDPTLARTLLDLSQAAQINDSLKVGRSVLDGISAVNTLHKPAVEQAGFAVLKAPDIPSILVETAFISNPDEETKLRSERHQKRFAESMHEGIRRYFAGNPPLARGRGGAA